MTESSPRPEVVVWFGSPPKVERGPFNHLSRVWRARVTYVFTAPLREERVALGWDDGAYGQAEVLRVRDDSGSVVAFVSTVASERPEAIHIFAGFGPPVDAYLKAAVRLLPSRRVLIFSERPGVYGPAWKRLVRKVGLPLRYWVYYLRYRNRIGLVLPLGQLGAATFSRFGWPSARLVPFMYCPDEENSAAPPDGEGPPPSRDLGGGVRFVYVGRFTRYTKGTDLLIKAFDGLRSEGWSLDLVGGYGDLRDQTIAWAEAHPQVRFCGSWSSDELITNLPDYDVVVVPSRFDGWNVTVNEAIRAGIGTISSDETVSHELIEESGAGIVVRANSASELRRVVELAIQHPEQIALWKTAARSFSPRIAATSVGEYLESVLDWHLGRRDARPCEPWHLRGGDSEVNIQQPRIDGSERPVRWSR